MFEDLCFYLLPFHRAVDLEERCLHDRHRAVDSGCLACRSTKFLRSDVFEHRLPQAIVDIPCNNFFHTPCIPDAFEADEARDVLPQHWRFIFQAKPPSFLIIERVFVPPRHHPWSDVAPIREHIDHNDTSRVLPPHFGMGTVSAYPASYEIHIKVLTFSDCGILVVVFACVRHLVYSGVPHVLRMLRKPHLLQVKTRENLFEGVNAGRNIYLVGVIEDRLCRYLSDRVIFIFLLFPFRSPGFNMRRSPSQYC
mmetsp:Transcript_11094/g.18073  ORF Transcript_11094/g.18073 Transcript_11094/m.18073 type:complete len:252 (+) Transcript_11094:469-1224(+)